MTDTPASKPTVTELLDFEAEHASTHPGRKESLIRDRWGGLRYARYTQLLLAAIRTPEAMQHDPFTTKRLLAKFERGVTTRLEKRFR